MRKFIYCAAILIALIINKVKSQPFYFRHYQIENGLSHNSVFCAIQDKNGFMWFGTRDGLNRFDGYNFKVFRNKANDTTSIGSNLINSLYLDKQGLIWVSTSNGLYTYNYLNESFTLVKFTEHLNIGQVREDQSHHLWIIANYTLIKYNLHSHKHDAYAENKYFEATGICIDEDGNLWVASSSGTINRYNARQNRFEAFNMFNHSVKTKLRFISSVYSTGRHSILTGTANHGVKLFDIKTKSYKDLINYNDDNKPLFVRDFCKYGDDDYWIATESGLLIYNLKTNILKTFRKDTTNPYALSDNAVYALCCDKEKGMWVTTYFGGINYFNPQNAFFEKFFPNNSNHHLTGNSVREFCPDVSGNNIWIGTEDAGLNKFNTASNQFFNLDSKSGTLNSAINNIHGLLISGQHLWIGTFVQGLYVMDLKTGRIIKHYSSGKGQDQLKSDFIETIYKTRSGEILIGTPNGLFRYHAITDNFSRVTSVRPDIFVHAITEDENGTIWIATLGSGLYYYNDKTQVKGSFTYSGSDPGSVSSNRLTSVFVDSRHQLWATSENGLNKFVPQNKSFISYTTADGFPSNFMFKIIEDNQHLLWISTTKGLVCFDQSTSKTRVYTKSNGLLSDQFSYNSAYKDRRGFLYFGCINGFIRFNPSLFIQNNNSPPIYIIDLQIDNQEIEMGAKSSLLSQSITTTKLIKLNSDQKSFSIDFAALSYIAPQSTKYAYKLEGFDKGWTYLNTNRRVYFTKLPPGNYLFRLKAANNNGLWNPIKVNLAIIISPPFYAGIWAYLLYLILFSVGLYYLIRYYHKRTQQRHKRKVELLENEMAKEIYQSKIEFFTNITHEIRTPLTLIKAPLEKAILSDDIVEIKNSFQLIQKNTDRLINLTDQLLDFRKVEKQGLRLNFVKADIGELIEDLFNQFKVIAGPAVTTYRLTLPAIPVLAYVDMEAFNKILSNLINNAIKYADCLVHIQLFGLSLHAKSFIVEIQNDGPMIPLNSHENIFQPFYRVNDDSNHNGTGLGLPLARSLAEIHQGTLSVKLHHELNIFILSLPVHQDIEFELFDELNNDTMLLREDSSAKADQLTSVILLIEDNCEIRNFLYQELTLFYTVKMAVNGLNAIDILKENNIDLIVSDIKMPVMDGLELCKEVKNNLDYSHIPIILLTAKNTLQAKLEGLEQGADAYIEKPFSPEHLQVQIKNLLNNRNKIKDHFANSPHAPIKSLGYSRADERFLESLNKVITLNMHNADFDIDQLADAMNMGRRTLFRKIKAISSLTPNELIMIAKLKKAAGLLLENEYKIYEIADMVGFGSAKVFSRAFQKQFGTPPTDYIKAKS